MSLTSYRQFSAIHPSCPQAVVAVEMSPLHLLTLFECQRYN